MLQAFSGKPFMPHFVSEGLDNGGTAPPEADGPLSISLNLPAPKMKFGFLRFSGAELFASSNSLKLLPEGLLCRLEEGGGMG